LGSWKRLKRILNSKYDRPLGCWLPGERCETPNTTDSWVVGNNGRPRENTEYYGLLGCWKQGEAPLELRILWTLGLLEARGGPARTPNTANSWVVGSKGRPRYNSKYYKLLGCWKHGEAPLELRILRTLGLLATTTWGDDAGKE